MSRVENLQISSVEKVQVKSSNKKVVEDSQNNIIQSAVWIAFILSYKNFVGFLGRFEDIKRTFQN